MQYTPTARLSAVEAMCHPFFDEIKEADVKLPDGRDINSTLFELTPEELKARPDLISRMLPAWKVEEYKTRGVEVIECMGEI